MLVVMWEDLPAHRWVPGVVERPRRPLGDEHVEIDVLSEADVADVVASVGPGEATAWTPRVGPYDEAAAHELVADAAARMERGELLALAVRDREHGGLAGGVSLIPSGAAHAEAAYWTVPALRGRGHAGRALIRVCDWALYELGLTGVWLEVAGDNPASLAVAGKAGFRAVEIDAGGLDNAGRGAAIIAAACEPPARRPPRRARAGRASASDGWTYLARLRRTPAAAGYRVRAATMSDLDEVTAVVVAAETADAGESFTSSEEVCNDWTSLARFELARDSWVVVDEERRRHRTVGYAWLWDEIEHVQLIGSLYVHPDARGRGLEEVLLDRLEARAREHAAGSGGEALFGTYTEPRNAERLRLFAAHGFRKTREFDRMFVDLDDLEERPQVPAGIELRPFRPGVDDAAVHAALEEGFEEHFWNAPMTLDEWRAIAMKDRRHDPGLWLVAWDGDEVVGASVSLVHRESETGYVDSLAVRKPWRGRGIGTALLKGSFVLFRERGCRRAMLGVDRENITPAVRLYEGAGMASRHRTDFFEKPVWPATRG
jgi:mycothiol synthase